MKNYDGGWTDRVIRQGLRSAWISHLFIADDCFLSVKADARSAHQLNDILQAYSAGSRQCVNKAKSLVFLSPKCGASTRVGVRNTLQVHKEALQEKYLGLPTVDRRITEQNFEHICKQSRSRVQDYSEKISCVANEVLLK